MKKHLVWLLVVMSIVLAFTGCASSEGSGKDKSWDNVKEKGELIMGLDDSFPPMGFRDENNEITGFDVDVAKEVCDRLGIKLTLQQIVWDTKEKELNSGKIDCIWNGFTITDARKKQVLFTKPYMSNRQVLVVKSDSDLAGLDDFEGKRLALQAGSSAADALEASADFKAKLGEIAEFDDNMLALMDLQKGGVDVVLMDEVVANYNIQVGGMDVKVLEEALATEEYGIGFRLNDNALMSKVQETLDAMKKDGTLAEISLKWFGKDVT